MSPEIAQLIWQRRAALREAGADSAVPSSGQDDTWGLALSGGGIRSATFCFGLLHALAAKGLLLRFDLLSTVSGGGYIGSMLGRLFHRAQTPADTIRIADALARGNNSWFAWWLRANGRYLVPQGLKDRFFALAVYLRNLLGIHLELGLVGLVLGVLLAAADLAGWKLLAVVAGRWWLAVEWAREWIVWIPTLYVLLPILVAVALALCWSFWLVTWQVEWPASLRWAVGSFAVGALVLWTWRSRVLDLVAKWPLIATALVVIAVLAIVAMLTATAAIRIADGAVRRARTASHHIGDPQVEIQDGARNRLTKVLSATIRAMAWVILAGAVDRAAWWLAFEHASWVDTGYALAIAAALLRVLLSPVSGLRQVAGGSKTLVLLLGLVGRLLTFCLFAWWVAVVHRGAVKAIFIGDIPAFDAALLPLLVIALVVIGYVVATGTDMRFLNLSSLHGFYRARLVRSYLGSVNPWRFLGAGPGVPELGAAEQLPRAPEDLTIKHVDDVDPRDDLPMHLYAPQRQGGPVHLLNVCLNETTDPRGGLFNRDRRGRVLTIGPEARLRVGRRDWQQIGGKSSDALTLGSWMAISGAAVSPGLGSMTRGGVSSLVMFAGARLGYWWDSRPLDPNRWSIRTPLSKLGTVLRETFGVFGGPEQRDWFLSDGGHFENTGAYALLAERTRVIFVADCGADPQYRFRDLENLVRKARIDLQADIEFLKPKTKPYGAAPESAEALAARFGSLNDLTSDTNDACFALARVAYGDTGEGSTGASAGRSDGYLILIKPNLCSGLPVDLFNFKAENPEFPQQSTADQFFDEAQWESYFQLGKTLGERFDRKPLEAMLDDVPALFERDDGSPVGGDEKRKENDGKNVLVLPPGRLPSRLTTVAASTLGLGAVSALSVALWQGIEAVKQAHEQQVKDERAALKELTDLWAKITTDPTTRSATANALAATLARVSDTLCPNGDAGWFNRSPLAVDLLKDTLEACAPARAGATMPGACEWLVRASDRNAEGLRSSCLMVGRTIAEQQAGKDGCAIYWAYDYRLHAVSRCAHPGVLLARGVPAQSASAVSGTGTQMPSNTTTAADHRRACDGKTIAPMVYGTRDLASLQRYVQVWQGQQLSVDAPRDLMAIARDSGRSSPLPVDVTTIRYRESASLACAQALPRMVQAEGWRIEPAAESKNARADVLEVWVAPGALAGSPPLHEPPPSKPPTSPTRPPSPPPAASAASAAGSTPSSASPPASRASSPSPPAPEPSPSPPPAASAASGPAPTASSASAPPPMAPPASAPAPKPSASAACRTPVARSCNCVRPRNPAPPASQASSATSKKSKKPRAKPPECGAALARWSADANGRFRVAHRSLEDRESTPADIRPRREGHLGLRRRPAPLAGLVDRQQPRRRDAQADPVLA